jgi:sugar O-acyltransferase (sialic acid O-acetyltransferase NeuD family)
MTKTKKLLIVGIGETSLLAAEYFRFDSDFEVVAFLADYEYIDQKDFDSCPLVAIGEAVNFYPPSEYFAFVAMGSGTLNRDRTKVCRRMKELGYSLASYVSTRAFVWPNVKIGDNCFVLEHNTLQPFTQLGNNVVLWSGNHIGHRTVIEDNCFITSHVVISGFCTIGEFSFLGVNSSIADGVQIGKDNFIAMGTSIAKSTAEDCIYSGNPAELRSISAKRFCRVRQ